MQSTPPVLRFPNTSNPTFKSVSPDLIFEEYINTNDFLKTNIFFGVRVFLNTFYRDNPTPSMEINKVSLAANETMFVL